MENTDAGPCTQPRISDAPMRTRRKKKRKRMVIRELTCNSQCSAPGGVPDATSVSRVFRLQCDGVESCGPSFFVFSRNQGPMTREAPSCIPTVKISAAPRSDHSSPRFVSPRVSESSLNSSKVDASDGRISSAFFSPVLRSRVWRGQLCWLFYTSIFVMCCFMATGSVSPSVCPFIRRIPGLEATGNRQFCREYQDTTALPIDRLVDGGAVLSPSFNLGEESGVARSSYYAHSVTEHSPTRHLLHSNVPQSSSGAPEETFVLPNWWVSSRLSQTFLAVQQQRETTSRNILIFPPILFESHLHIFKTLASGLATVGHRVTLLVGSRRDMRGMEGEGLVQAPDEEDTDIIGTNTSLPLRQPRCVECGSQASGFSNRTSDSAPYYRVRRYPALFSTAEGEAFLQERVARILNGSPTFLELFKTLKQYARNCDALFSTGRDIIEMLRKDQYSLVIVDPNEMCGFLLAAELRVPYIVFSTGMWVPFEADVPTPTSYVPVFNSELTDRMTFLQRLYNSAFYLGTQAVTRFGIFPMYDRLIARHDVGSSSLRSASDVHSRNASFSKKEKDSETFPPNFSGESSIKADNGGKDIASLVRGSQAWLLCTDFALEFPRPLMPHVEYIGGILRQPAKPLIESIQRWADASAQPLLGSGASDHTRTGNGFVAVSFGAGVNRLNPKLERIFLDVFASLPLKVIWRYSLPKGISVPNNIRVVHWLPQNDILAHPNIRAFVGHGGTNGVYECLSHGVPIVGMPLFGDQYDTMVRVHAKKIGIMLRWKSLTAKVLREAILTVVENPKYKQSARYYSQIHRDTQLNPLERAVSRIDYVLRYNGAGHLRPAGVGMGFFQYFVIDGWTCVAIVLASIVVVVKSIFIHRVASTSKDNARGDNADGYNFETKLACLQPSVTMPCKSHRCVLINQPCHLGCVARPTELSKTPMPLARFPVDVSKSCASDVHPAVQACCVLDASSKCPSQADSSASALQESTVHPFLCSTSHDPQCGAQIMQEGAPGNRTAFGCCLYRKALTKGYVGLMRGTLPKNTMEKFEEVHKQHCSVAHRMMLTRRVLYTQPSEALRPNGTKQNVGLQSKLSFIWRAITSSSTATIWLLIVRPLIALSSCLSYIEIRMSNIPLTGLHPWKIREWEDEQEQAMSEERAPPQFSGPVTQEPFTAQTTFFASLYNTYLRLALCILNLSRSVLRSITCTSPNSHEKRLGRKRKGSLRPAQNSMMENVTLVDPHTTLVGALTENPRENRLSMASSSVLPETSNVCCWYSCSCHGAPGPLKKQLLSLLLPTAMRLSDPFLRSPLNERPPLIVSSDGCLQKETVAFVSQDELSNDRTRTMTRISFQPSLKVTSSPSTRASKSRRVLKPTAPAFDCSTAFTFRVKRRCQLVAKNASSSRRRGSCPHPFDTFGKRAFGVTHLYAPNYPKTCRDNCCTACRFPQQNNSSAIAGKSSSLPELQWYQRCGACRRCHSYCCHLTECAENTTTNVKNYVPPYNSRDDVTHGTSNPAATTFSDVSTTGSPTPLVVSLKGQCVTCRNIQQQQQVQKPDDTSNRAFSSTCAASKKKGPFMDSMLEISTSSGETQESPVSCSICVVASHQKEEAARGEKAHMSLESVIDNNRFLHSEPKIPFGMRGCSSFPSLSSPSCRMSAASSSSALYGCPPSGHSPVSSGT